MFDEEDPDGQRDYDLHYCESSPSYYCEELYCELKEFGYKCPNESRQKTEVDRTWVQVQR